MLSLSFIGVQQHKKSKVFVLPTLSAPPPSMYIDNGGGQSIRDPAAPPVVSSVILGNIDFNSVRVALDVFMAPSAITHCEINVYEYAETDPYNSNLLKFNTSTNARAEVRLHVLATNLNESTNYRVRIRAVSYVNSQTLVSEWFEETFTTEEIPAGLNGLYNGFYYIDGAKTALSSFGEGLWNNIYYINGIATDLEYIQCMGLWVGYLWGRFHVNFAQYSGLFTCDCCTAIQKQTHEGNYVNGLRRPQGWSGTGFIPSYLPTSPWMTAAYGYTGGAGSYGTTTTYYVASVPFSGYANGKFYVDGVESPFDLNGVGSIQVGGTTYNFSNGVPVSGHRDGVYYIGGVATSLSADGTGTWNNSIYNKGGFVSLVNTPYSWQSGAIDEYNYYGSSFGSGITYG